MTHTELVERGAKWLRSRFGCFVVLAEMQTHRTAEQPDVIGWHCGGWSILVECKASRADFMADRKKPHRIARGMGQERWYLAPAGMLQVSDMPEGWGLAEVRASSISIACRPHGTILGAPGTWIPRNAAVADAELGFTLGALNKVQTGQINGLRVAMGIIAESESP